MKKILLIVLAVVLLPPLLFGVGLGLTFRGLNPGKAVPRNSGVPE